MSETTETTTQNSAPGWKAAMAASAEASRAPDPKPRPFIEELDVKLTEKERVQIAVKFADTCQDITAKKAALKALVSEHKADIASLESVASELCTTIQTGRVKREVQCEEHIVFSQNRKFSIRLDTKEEFNEMPLTASDRQVLLVPEDKEDGQLALAAVNDGAEEVEGSDDVEMPDFDESEDERDSTTNLVDDPEGLLIAASEGAEPAAADPPSKPRRGRKAT